MTPAAARAKAEEIIAEAATMNASYEHIPSKNKAFLAGTVIDLCSQLDAAHAKIAEFEAATKTGTPIVAPEPVSVPPDAHLGAIGDE